MRNIRLILPLAVLFYASACEKKSAAPDYGSWKLGATTHNVAFSMKSNVSSGGKIFIFADAAITGPGSSANTFNISFPTEPTASGTFQLVSTGTSTAANQMEVAAGSIAGGAYAYLGAPVNVTVTVSGGKLSLVLPEITVKSTTGLPDVTLSASVKEM